MRRINFIYMLKKYTLPFLFILAFMSTNASSQDIFVDARAGIGIPFSLAESNLDRNALDIGVSIGKMNENSNLGFGFDAGFKYLGNESISDIIVEQNEARRFKTKISYNIINTNIFLRLTSKHEEVIPFLDMLVGVNILTSSDNITIPLNDPDNFNFTGTISERIATSYALNYGLRTGISFILSESETSIYKLFASATYLMSTKSEFIKPGSIRFDGVAYSSEIAKTKSDYLTFNLGLRVYFD